MDSGHILLKGLRARFERTPFGQALVNAPEVFRRRTHDIAILPVPPLHMNPARNLSQIRLKTQLTLLPSGDRSPMSPHAMRRAHVRRPMSDLLCIVPILALVAVIALDIQRTTASRRHTRRHGINRYVVGAPIILVTTRTSAAGLTGLDNKGWRVAAPGGRPAIWPVKISVCAPSVAARSAR